MNVSANGKSEVGPEPVMVSDAETTAKDKSPSPKSSDSIDELHVSKPEQAVPSSSRSSGTSETSSPTESMTEDTKKVHNYSPTHTLAFPCV